MSKWKSIVLVAAMLAALLLSPFAQAEGDKVVRLTQNVELDTLDISNTGDGYATSMMALLLDSLFRLDENNVPQPALCESYTVSDDGLTYTFTLRDSKWSNGDPVTAADFVYSWKRTCNPANGFENAFLFNYVPIKNLAEISAGEADPDTLGVTAVDDKTLVLELTTPCNWLLEFLCGCYFGPMNQAFVESCGDQYALSSDTLLTCGAFKLEGWTAGDLTWTITKNEDYWAADTVNVDAIEYQVIKDTQTGIMAYESGTADYVILTSDLVDMYRDSEAFYTAPTTYSWYIVPNFQVPELQNANLRYAIGFAIDREALVNNILADGSLAKYDCNYSDVFFGSDGTEFNSVRPDFWQSDKEAAAAYWEAAKEELGVDSLELDFTIEDTESAQNVAAFIQSEIETACPGLTINLQVMPKAQRLDDMENGNFELGLHRTGSSVPNVLAKLGQYTTGHNLNYAFCSFPEYDELYNATLVETDPEVIWNNCLDLEEMAQRNAVAIPVYRTADCLLIRPSMSGYFHHLVGVSWDFMNVDIAE